MLGQNGLTCVALLDLQQHKNDSLPLKRKALAVKQLATVTIKPSRYHLLCLFTGIYLSTGRGLIKPLYKMAA